MDNFNVYPFSIGAIAKLQQLEFHPQLTFFVGENGSGKSTLIEAIALALGFAPDSNDAGQNLSQLHAQLKLHKANRNPQDGCFLRAESFYTLDNHMDELAYLESYDGEPTHRRSHGESFMDTLSNKLKGQGLYIMDEPEAALSPLRQMAALSAIHRLIEQDSQFIIATHSPILMAYPGATIYHFSASGIKQVNYQDTEHFTVTRDFLLRHEQMVEYLLD
ncbi:MAG: AAA family ATPase [Cellvibrionaceae bacterium]|nr:AAA family ATPase [Cellvibrionaceae bacterium]